MNDSEIPVDEFGSADLEANRSVLLDVYEEVYAQQLNDPFFASDRYWGRLQGYASRGGFSTAIATSNGSPVGYALGYTLPEGSGWWRGLQPTSEAIDMEEDGRRTFAVTEIMVLESFRRKGVARALHAALLGKRPEARATLLVLPDNGPARAAYSSWGWRTVGTIKPFDDSPTYESMLLDLKAPQ